jgi:predicted thioredoxin/glutaredoxin
MYDSYVMVDGEEVLLDNVEFLNIEEHISGRDLVTFIYNGEVKKSFVIQRMKW